VGKLLDLIREEIKTDVVQYTDRVTTTVGTSVTRILRADPDRVAVILLNLGGNDLYISPDEAPSATRGIYVGANGGSVVMLWNEDLILVGNEWFGVAPGGTTQIFTVELVGV